MFKKLRCAAGRLLLKIYDKRWSNKYIRKVVGDKFLNFVDFVAPIHIGTDREILDIANDMQDHGTHKLRMNVKDIGEIVVSRETVIEFNKFYNGKDLITVNAARDNDSEIKRDDGSLKIIGIKNRASRETFVNSHRRLDKTYKPNEE